MQALLKVEGARAIPKEDIFVLCRIRQVAVIGPKYRQAF
jgi:hypothetical protein